MKVELVGYAGLALTIIGQILVGYFYLAGLTCWLVANLLFLIKAIIQCLDNAEIIRNVVMLGVTAGLILLWVLI